MIARSHRPLISSSVCRCPCISLSHLSTQIRYADSERSICRSRDSPRCVTLPLPQFAPGFSAFVLGCRFYAPAAEDSFYHSSMSDHWMFGCGQRFSVALHQNVSHLFHDITGHTCCGGCCAGNVVGVTHVLLVHISWGGTLCTGLV